MLYNPPHIIQSQFLALVSDVSTTSVTFTDLTGMSLDLYTDTYNPVIVWFHVSGDASIAAEVSFQLVIDGVAKRGAHFRSTASGSGHSAQLLYRTGSLSRGLHTIKIQWLTTTGSARIFPSTTHDGANLLVEEVSV